jgi:hypothetical protein
MKIYSRSRWGARRPRERTPQTLGPDSILFFHYSEGQGRGIENLKEQAAALRGIQNFHMDTRGWSDIAYSRLICQPYGKLRRARCFEGRGLNTVPASQINHNTGNVSYCILAKPGEPLKAATKRLMIQAAKEHKGRYIAGHRDGGDTDCPGDLIYRELDSIARAAGKHHWKG